MRQARISCPHCGGSITVRQIETEGAIPPERTAQIWARTDEMFRVLNEQFNKVFDPRLWRSG